MFGLPRNGTRRFPMPRVITGKDSIPFCIPSTKYHSTRRDASNLGSLNPDLYMVDRFETETEAGGPTGCFSSYSKPDFPPDNVGRVWFFLKYEEKTEKLIFSLLKARNLRRCIEGDTDLESQEFCGSARAPLQNDRLRQKATPSKIKEMLLGLARSPDKEAASTQIEAPTKWQSLDMTRTKSEPGSPPQINNVFVKIYLLPEKRVHGQAQSKKRLGDHIFVERFVFQVSPPQLKSKTLRMVFVEIDQEKKHHIIGHVTYPLCINRLDGEIVYKDLEKGMPLSSDSTKSSGVDIHISLCYDSDLSRLTVLIFQVELPCELSSGESGMEIDFEVILTAFGWPGKSKRRKVSSTKKVQIGPDPAEGTRTGSKHLFEITYVRSFPFELPSSINVNNASITIKLMIMTTQGQIRCRVSVGGQMFVGGKAAEHWEDMQSRPKEFVRQWHRMSFEQEW